MKNTTAYEAAKKRVAAKMGFRTHFLVFVAVNLLLLMINLSEGDGYLWVKWPIMGWGIGLLFHGLGVYFF